MGTRRLVISTIIFGLLLILVSCKSTEKTKAYFGHVYLSQQGIGHFPDREVLLIYDNKTFESVFYLEAFERISRYEKGVWSTKKDTITLFYSDYPEHFPEHFVMKKSDLLGFNYVLDSLGNKHGYMRTRGLTKVPSETTKKVVQLIKSN